MKVTISLLLVLGILALARAEYPTPMPQKIAMPKYTIALETAPENRWDAILEEVWDYRKELAFVEMSHVVPEVAGWGSDLIHSWALSHMGDYGLEIQGFVKKVKELFPQTVLTEAKLLVLNLLYSFDASCTSAVADSPDGVLHGRNMDFGFTSVLRLLSVDITWTKNGKPLYTGATFLGYSGILTGMRFDGFGISVDARHKDDSLLGNVIRLLFGYPDPSLLLRDTLEKATTYEEATAMLSSSHMSSSMYFIVSGTEEGQGTVLTRTPYKLVNAWPIDAAAGEWWRLETNYDHWEAPPTYDDRRTLGNEHFKEIGGPSKNSKTAMFDKVFSQIPNLRPYTVYTTIMCPADGTFETYIWWYY